MNEITKELLDALATLAAPQSDDGWIPWAGGGLSGGQRGRYQSEGEGRRC